ncbi:GNAT family N-acetyltransferase [Legionella drozanskii]|uniref:GNAT family acetyltransferase n=1 Tax=Legionella drozanskii LLAP-1 TaxID=1212489 RepID=A0A0W0SVN7_9GAMM|nr:GNAT family N-acetyltransferase [Legionella drozanskii]KTC87361.1 GNAT family acetyltransferase [Legionella drozanskii LLAP-1]
MTIYNAKEIESTRLLLTKPTNKDVPILENLWRNEAVRKFLGGTLTDEIIHQRIADLQNHWELYNFGLLVVFEKFSQQIMGLCGLHHSDDGIEISYMFFPDFWEKGFASEAVKACVAYGFNVLKIERIIAITQLENTKSCRLLNKIGMRHISNFMRFNAIQSVYELKR